MKIKVAIIAMMMVVAGHSAMAQKFSPDAKDDKLKGNVKSVLTTTRTPQGRVVGHPERNNYNKEGYYTQKTLYDTIGNPVIVVSYSYDKKNRLVKDVRTQEPYSELLSQVTYKYDKKSRTVTAEMFGIADSLEERNVYYFDKNNNIMKVTNHSADNKDVASTIYEYDKYGNRVYATFIEGENEIYTGAEKYRYDTDGFLAEKCSYYLTTLRQAFLYTYYYDEQGNWTQAYVYHVTPSEGYIYQVITRQITYYED
jgi:hypothetical protein